MSDTSGDFRLVDATGSGGCRIDRDGRVEAMSDAFRLLTGLGPSAVGQAITTVLPELPPLDRISTEPSDDLEVFRRTGEDGVVRELAPVWVCEPGEGGGFVVVLDRSGMARLLRQKAQLGRQVEDLRAELEARESGPLTARIRSMRELAARLEESLRQGRRYQHPVTVLRLRAELTSDDADLGTLILSCVRGVDEVGMLGEGEYAVVLPHTDLAGGKLVAERLHEHMRSPSFEAPSVGVAQVMGSEAGSALVARAERACRQAAVRGGGVLLAVDVL